MTTDAKYKKLQVMAKDLFDMRFSDETGIDNYFLDNFMAHYISILIPKLDYWFETVWKHQTSKRESYGDIDHSITKFESVFIGESKPSPLNKNETWKDDDKKMRVMFFEDHSSCADHTKFLVVQERTSWAENNADDAAKFDKKTLAGFARFDTFKYHLRIIYDKTDYKKGNQYVNRPNLKWYKDRQFNVGYVEKLHATPLGGCYGDCRDNGYILSAKYNSSTKLWDVEHQALLHNFHMFRHICRNLTSAMYDLSEKNSED